MFSCFFLFSYEHFVIMNACNHLTWLWQHERQLKNIDCFERLVRELTHSSNQYSRLVHFIDSRTKNSVLRQWFLSNKRKHKIESINLHLEISFSNFASSLLFANSNSFNKESWDQFQNNCHEKFFYFISWASDSNYSFFDILHARLLFLFSDVICVFANNFLSLHSVVSRI